MKETFESSSINDLIEYRLNRALETIEEADYNAKGGYFNAAVNRLYYSCYYAADYEDFVYCNLELFNELRPQAEDFVRTIHSLIRH